MIKNTRAKMAWKGRTLMCNGACVDRVYKFHLAWSGTWWGTMTSQKEFRNERTARRAINRHFKLPPDFGAKP